MMNLLWDWWEPMWRPHSGSAFSPAPHFLQPSHGKISALEKDTKMRRATTHSSEAKHQPWDIRDADFDMNRFQDETRDLVYSHTGQLILLHT